MTTIITKHSETPGAQPSNLAVGELAVNTADATLWTYDGSVIKSIGGSGGGGDGSVPSGSADGQMLRWTSTGEPTWSVTEDIQVTTDSNVAIGGDQLSAAYKLTVNGDSWFTGSLHAHGIDSDGGLTVTQTSTLAQVNVTTGLTVQGSAQMTMESGNINMYANPTNSAQLGNRGYNDARYMGPGVAIAGGFISSDGSGSQSTSNCYGVSSVSLYQSSGFTVTLSSAVSSTSKMIVTGSSGASLALVGFEVEQVSSSQFRCYLFNVDGPTNASGASFHFAVHDAGG